MAGGAHQAAFLLIAAAGGAIAVRVCEFLDPPRRWPCDEPAGLEPEDGETASGGAP